ncbi:MAG: ATP-grasp domain-containing protein [Elusimicrobiota bacterium]
MEIFEKLKKNKWSWWGQRGHDALGLNSLINFDLIACCDWGKDHEKIWGRENVFSLEKEYGKRKNYSNEDLNLILKGALKKRIEPSFKKPLNCLMYRSIGSLENMAGENKNINIISAPVKLKKKFDNKILFRNWLIENNIEPIPGEVTRAGAKQFSSLKNKWGAPFVVQFPFGSSGENTFIIKTESQFKKITSLNKNSLFIILKYIPGFSLNTNAVAGNKHISLSPVSLQIIGSPGLSGRKFGFAGNDFSSAEYVSRKIKNKIYDITLKTARWLRKSGFRGMMGLDFLSDGSNVYPIEINPRFQNSTSLLTLIELSQKRMPLALKHISEFMSIELNNDFMFEPKGSQLIMHSLEKKPVILENSLKAGIYTLKGSEICFLREGFSLIDCKGKNEFALCCGVPEKGTCLLPGAPLVKLHFPAEVLKRDMKTLKKTIDLTVKKIYNAYIR